MAGLVPAISLQETHVCPPKRGHRDKPGDDNLQPSGRRAAYTSAASLRAGLPVTSDTSGAGSGVPGSRKRLVIG